MSQQRIISFLAVILILGLTAWAGVPQQINFQGQLRNGGGSPLANDTLSAEFKIYDALVSGNVKWSEIDTVITDANGLFTVLLGKNNPIPDSVFDDSLRWLGIKVGSDPEISPRQRLSSVGYSYVSSQWNSAGQNLFRLNGNVGIGTSTPGAKLSVNTSGTFGVYALGGFYGVYGTSGFVGGQFNATGGGSYGVYGQSNGIAAVYGDILGNFGTWGGYFQGDVKVERNLVVNGTSSSSAGVNASSSSGPGVVATGFTNGVEATGGTRGLYAGGGDYGVVGFATGNANPHVGIYGAESGDLSTAWAGWFAGRVYVGGFLEVDGFIFKDGGGFRIDHPTDPANKYLYHSFVESPDMTNFYNGNVTLDAKGEATVELPDWFGALNKDYRYQLTAMGAPGPNLYIAREISGNQFKIAGGTPAMKVSWQVTGVRQDAYANAHRIPVEVVKLDKERGKYLHPQEQGVSETLGMHFEENQKMAAERKAIEERQAKMEVERKKLEEDRSQMEQEPSPHQQ